MRTYKLHLQDATHYECIEAAVSFVGQDRSGSFGILAGHARMITSLVFGLARYRTEAAGWVYLAMPGGLLYFVDNQLYLSTRRFLKDADYERIMLALEEQLLTEEEGLYKIKESLHRLEEEMLKRLWRMKRAEGL